MTNIYNYESPIRADYQFTVPVKIAFVQALLENGGIRSKALQTLKDKGLVDETCHASTLSRAEAADPVFGKDVADTVKASNKVLKNRLRTDNAELLQLGLDAALGREGAVLPEGVDFKDISFLSKAVREFTDPVKKPSGNQTNIDIHNDNRQLNLPPGMEVPKITFEFAGDDEKEKVHARREERRKLLIDGTAERIEHKKEAAALG